MRSSFGGGGRFADSPAAADVRRELEAAAREASRERYQQQIDFLRAEKGRAQAERMAEAEELRRRHRESISATASREHFLSELRAGRATHPSLLLGPGSGQPKAGGWPSPVLPPGGGADLDVFARLTAENEVRHEVACRRAEQLEQLTMAEVRSRPSIPRKSHELSERLSPQSRFRRLTSPKRDFEGLAPAPDARTVQAAAPRSGQRLRSMAGTRRPQPRPGEAAHIRRQLAALRGRPMDAATMELAEGLLEALEELQGSLIHGNHRAPWVTASPPRQRARRRRKQVPSSPPRRESPPPPRPDQSPREWVDLSAGSYWSEHERPWSGASPPPNPSASAPPDGVSDEWLAAVEELQGRAEIAVAAREAAQKEQVEAVLEMTQPFPPAGMRSDTARVIAHAAKFVILHGEPFLRTLQRKHSRPPPDSEWSWLVEPDTSPGKVFFHQCLQYEGACRAFAEEQKQGTVQQQHTVPAPSSMPESAAGDHQSEVPSIAATVDVRAVRGLNKLGIDSQTHHLYAVLRCGTTVRQTVARPPVLSPNQMMSAQWDAESFLFRTAHSSAVVLIELYASSHESQDQPLGQAFVRVSEMGGAAQWHGLLPMKGCDAPQGELQLCCTILAAEQSRQRQEQEEAEPPEPEHEVQLEPVQEAKPEPEKEAAFPSDLVTFTKTGSLGLTFASVSDAEPPQLIKCKVGTQAMDHPELSEMIGRTLKSVDGRPVVDCESGLLLIKAAGRPVTLEFLSAPVPVPLAGDAAGDDRHSEHAMTSLQAELLALEAASPSARRQMSPQDLTQDTQQPTAAVAPPTPDDGWTSMSASSIPTRPDQSTEQVFHPTAAEIGDMANPTTALYSEQSPSNRWMQCITRIALHTTCDFPWVHLGYVEVGEIVPVLALGLDSQGFERMQVAADKWCSTKVNNKLPCFIPCGPPNKAASSPEQPPETTPAAAQSEATLRLQMLDDVQMAWPGSDISLLNQYDEGLNTDFGRWQTAEESPRPSGHRRRAVRARARVATAAEMVEERGIDSSADPNMVWIGGTPTPKPKVRKKKKAAAQHATTKAQRSRQQATSAVMENSEAEQMREAAAAEKRRRKRDELAARAKVNRANRMAQAKLEAEREKQRVKEAAIVQAAEKERRRAIIEKEKKRRRAQAAIDRAKKMEQMAAEDKVQAAEALLKQAKEQEAKAAQDLASKKRVRAMQKAAKRRAAQKAAAEQAKQEEQKQESKSAELRAAQQEARRRATQEAAAEQAKRDEQKAMLKKKKEESKAAEFVKQWSGKHVIVVEPGSPYINKTGVVVKCSQRSGLETVSVRFDGLPENAAPRTLRLTAVKIAGKWAMEKHAASQDAATLDALKLGQEKVGEARSTNAQTQLTLLAAASSRSPRQSEMRTRRAKLMESDGFAVTVTAARDLAPVQVGRTGKREQDGDSTPESTMLNEHESTSEQEIDSQPIAMASEPGRDPTLGFVTVACPDGVSAGDLVSFMTDGGVELEVQVPDGIQPGEDFEVEVQPQPAAESVQVDVAAPRQARTVILTCPSCVSNGLASFLTTGGQVIDVEIPDGIQPGERFEVELEEPTDAEQPLSHTDIADGVVVNDEAESETPATDDVAVAEEVVEPAETITQNQAHTKPTLAHDPVFGAMEDLLTGPEASGDGGAYNELEALLSGGPLDDVVKPQVNLSDELDGDVNEPVTTDDARTSSSSNSETASVVQTILTAAVAKAEQAEHELLAAQTSMTEDTTSELDRDSAIQREMQKKNDAVDAIRAQRVVGAEAHDSSGNSTLPHTTTSVPEENSAASDGGMEESPTQHQADEATTDTATAVDGDGNADRTSTVQEETLDRLDTDSAFGELAKLLGADSHATAGADSVLDDELAMLLDSSDDDAVVEANSDAEPGPESEPELSKPEPEPEPEPDALDDELANLLGSSSDDEDAVHTPPPASSDEETVDAKAPVEAAASESTGVVSQTFTVNDNGADVQLRVDRQGMHLERDTPVSYQFTELRSWSEVEGQSVTVALRRGGELVFGTTNGAALCAAIASWVAEVHAEPTLTATISPPTPPRKGEGGTPRGLSSEESSSGVLAVEVTETVVKADVDPAEPPQQQEKQQQQQQEGEAHDVRPPRLNPPERPQLLSASSLCELTLAELEQKAHEAGISASVIRDAREAAQPKDTLISLLTRANQRRVRKVNMEEAKARVEAAKAKVEAARERLRRASEVEGMSGSEALAKAGDIPVDEGADVLRVWDVGAVVDVDTEDGIEYGAIILGPSVEGDPLEMQVKFLDGVVDDWPIRDFRLPVWMIGTVVDIDTEDGMEFGATVLGASESGDREEMRVRFADGVEDDWPVTDFRRGSKTAAPAEDLLASASVEEHDIGESLF